MKINMSDLSTQDDSSKNEALLSIERAKELEGQLIEKQLHGGFFLDKNENLMYQSESSNSKGEFPSPIYICSRLDVTAFTRDDNNCNHGCLLEFKDVDECHHTWAMPMGLLARDGTRYREELLSMGLRIATSPKARNLLTTYIQSSKPIARARCVTQTGWYKNCFIFPDQILGSSNAERLILQTPEAPFRGYTTAGTLESWRDSISSLCKGNTRLIFSTSIAFTPPLLNLLGIENGGFHFRGASSIGKSTVMAIASSIWGGKDYTQRWCATINGIEALATIHNDALLCLDEIGQVDSSIVGDVAYLLANGGGKCRSSRRGGFRGRATWRLVFLSNGELSMADHMKAAGKKPTAGQAVRIIDIPADTGKYGMFESLHGSLDGDTFSKTLEGLSRLHHGVAAREFIKYLVNQDDKIVALIWKAVNEFMQAYAPKNADGQIYRVARRFALSAAAGELATSFGITGWENGESTAAAKVCFFDWLNARGGNSSQEELTILSQVKRFFEQHGESRFTPWDATNEYRTTNRAGFRRLLDKGVEYFVFPETFKSDIAAGFDPRLVSKICIRHGLLREGTNGESTRSEQFPNSTSKTRCYRFTSKVLSGGRT